MGVSTASGHYAHVAVTGYLTAGYARCSRTQICHIAYKKFDDMNKSALFVSFPGALHWRGGWFDNLSIFLLCSCDMALMVSSAFPLHQSSEDANKLNFTGPCRCGPALALAGSIILQMVSFCLSKIVPPQQRLNPVLSWIQIKKFPWSLLLLEIFKQDNSTLCAPLPKSTEIEVKSIGLC